MSRRCWILAALAIGACGGGGSGDDAAPTPGPVPSVVLDVPAQLAPGNSLPVAWTIAGAPDGAQLSLRLREPGDPITPSRAGYLYTGSAPATGARWWIGASGTPAPDPTAVVGPAASGTVSVTLPSAAEGDWAIDAVMLDADGDVITMASSTVWVAAGPSLRLELSRTWAAPDDTVDATVVLRDAEVEPLRLSAWLTLPDGTVLSLPQGDAAYHPVAEGTLASGPIGLLSEQIGHDGEGRYLLSVKLETLDGTVRGRAGAVIQVCSTPGTIQGTAGGSDGTVLLDDPLDGTDLEVPVASDGTFTADVPAGSYLLFGSGSTWNDGAAVTVGCGEVATISLVDGATAFTAARLRSRAAVSRAAETPRKPSVRFIYGVDPRIDQNVGKALYNTVVGTIQNQAVPLGGGPIMVWTDFAARGVMEKVLNDQLAGVNESNSDLVDRAGGDYTILVQIRSENGPLIVDLEVQDARDGSSVASEHAEIATDADPVPIVEALAKKLLVEDRIVIKMREQLDLPANPLLWIHVSKTFASPGDVVTGLLNVAEASPNGPIRDRTATIELRAAGSATLVDSRTDKTDSHGNLTLSFTVPDSPATRYEFSGVLPRRTHLDARVPARGFDTRPPGFPGAIVGDKGTLDIHERTDVHFTVGVLSRVVLFAATNGVADAISVLADETGKGVVGFTAGVESGVARLLVTFETMTAMPIPIAIPFYVIDPIDLTAFPDPSPSTVDDAYVEIRGVVTREGVGVADVPVAFQRVGGGELAAGVKTDADGVYAGIFHSPLQGSGSTTIKVSSVLDSEIVEEEVQINYGPPCGTCPVAITPLTGPTQMLPIAKGGHQLFSANQPVIWSVTGDGTITSQGLFTAGDTGGTVLIRATSTADATNEAVARVVVDCTLDELAGTFTGTLQMSDIQVALPPFDCSLDAGVHIAGIGNDPQVDASAYLVCGSNQTLWGDFPRASLQGCTVGSSPSAPCPTTGLIGPDPDVPGPDHRVFIATERIQNGDGSCTVQFQGGGRVSR